MRIFSSCQDMVYEVERELFEMGIGVQSVSVQDIDTKENEHYFSKELIGYSYALTKWGDKDDIFSHYSFTKHEIEEMKNYALQEAWERVSKEPISNPGNSWKMRPSMWQPFLHSGKFSYTYHERINPQLSAFLDEVKKIGSRQTVITVYDACRDIKNWGGKARVPCSMYYQFMNRIEQGTPHLSLLYTMRSCDFYNHFPVDVYIALTLLDWVGGAIKSRPKRFIHFMGSLHAFQKDWSKRRIF